MDKKIIKGLIDEKMEVIQEQFSIIKAYEGKIPVIEIDLILANVRDLYELILSLQLENIGGALPHAPAPEVPKSAPPPAQITREEPVREPDEVIPEPPVQNRVSPSFISIEPVMEEKPAPVPEPEPEPYIPEPEYRIPEPVARIPEPETWIPEPVTRIPEPEPYIPEPVTRIPEPEPEPESRVPEADIPQEKNPKITFDLFSDATGTTLADRLREGQDKRIADKFTESKIADLRTTIGINEKFLFINELFDGNMRIYDEVIQKLNTAVTLAQADLLMLDLKIAYNWDSESPTVKKFVELIRRKF